MEQDIEFNDPSKVEAEWVPGNDSDSDEDDNFDLFKTSLIDLDLLGPPKLDHRFHWFFAVVLHILSSGVTYFSINYALYPDNLKYELMCKLLTPYSILAVCLVMVRNCASPTTTSYKILTFHPHSPPPHPPINPARNRQHRSPPRLRGGSDLLGFLEDDPPLSQPGVLRP